MGGAAGRDGSGLAPLYRQRPLAVAAGMLRSESLALFKAFFADPANDYWRDSLLARYTLDQ
jgi:tRNA(adenine34) deaminase